MTRSGFFLQRWEDVQPYDQAIPILPLWREWLAHFTGQWPAGYRPRWWRTPWWHLLIMLLSLVGSVSFGVFLTTQSLWLWPLLVFSWMGTVHSCRKAQLVICHHAVHGAMTGSAWGDRLLVEGLSTLLLIQHFAGYRHEHLQLHHSIQLATLADPDLCVLLHLGFRPGMRRQALWRQLYWTLISPCFHVLFMWMRLRVNFWHAPCTRRLISCLYVALLGGLLWLTQGWLVLLIVWLIPLFPLYHIAALLQFVSEHRWLYRLPSPSAVSPKLRLGRLTFGRFVGEPCPHRTLPLGRRWRAWGGWGVRLLWLHLPTRLCVLVGDLCQHDWHHRHPRGDWSNACYIRQRDLTAGCPGWPEPYTSVWGLDQAIDEVFTGLAALPPLPEPPSAWPTTDGLLDM